MPRPIELSLDSDGKLALSDGGRTKAGKIFNRNVSWKIKGSEIESFKIVGKAAGDPFTERPDSNFGTKLNLEVSHSARLGDWNYSIIWKDTATHTEHTYDPIITIKPVEVFFVLQIVTFFSVLFSIFFLFWRKKKRSK